MSPLRLYLPIIVCILLGFALRIHDLQAVPLRGDEAFSVLYWADLPVSVSLTQIAHGEPHTPLVYAVARLWRHLVGGIDSVFSLRYLSVLGNIIGVSAIFTLGWRLSHKTGVGLLAALMWALHPFEIWHSQEFRNYGYWAGMSVTTLWLGLRLIEGRRPWDWYLYAIAACFTTLAIYTEPFTTLALACFAVVERRRDRRFLRQLLVLQGGIGALLIAGFVLLQVRQGFASSYPGLVQAFSLTDYFTRFVPALVFGTTIPLNQSAVGLALSPVIGIAAVTVLRRSTRQFRFVALTAVLPLLLLGLVSSRYNLFHPRYVLAAVPAFILVLSLGSFEVAGYLRRFLKLSRSVGGFLLLLPWFALAVLTLSAHFKDPAFRRAPAWDELGAFLSPRVTENDLVIQLAVDPAFGYYYGGAAKDIGLPVKPDQSAAEIIAALRDISGEFESLYVVAKEQAGWLNAGVVEEWMRNNMQEMLRTDTSGLPVRQYMDWSVEHHFEKDMANFADRIALLGYELWQDPLPTGELLLWLYWKPLSRTDRPLKSFVHVYGEWNPMTGSALWAQDDQHPQRGRLDSTNWPTDAVFRDVYYLPAEALADGEYQISVGWYDPASGLRLSQTDGTDSFTLSTLHYSAHIRTSQ